VWNEDEGVMCLITKGLRCDVAAFTVETCLNYMYSLQFYSGLLVVSYLTDRTYGLRFTKLRSPKSPGVRFSKRLKKVLGRT